jgi:SAM-dependent methyltransferase
LDQWTVAPKEFPVSEFDRYASHYQELLQDPLRDRFLQGDADFFARRKWALLQEYMQRTGRRPEKLSWLDLGCGQGDLLRYGSGRFEKLRGCDVSQEMIEACAGVETRLMEDPTRIPFEDASADLLTAVCVFHHIDLLSRLPLMKEIVRVLRPGGVFCLIEHNPRNPITRTIVKRTPVDANAILLTAGEGERLIAAAGLQPEATDYFLYLPSRIYDRAAWMEKWLRQAPFGGQYAVFALKSKP